MAQKCDAVQNARACILGWICLIAITCVFLLIVFHYIRPMQNRDHHWIETDVVYCRLELKNSSLCDYSGRRVIAIGIIRDLNKGFSLLEVDGVQFPVNGDVDMRKLNGLQVIVQGTVEKYTEPDHGKYVQGYEPGVTFCYLFMQHVGVLSNP